MKAKKVVKNFNITRLVCAQSSHSRLRKIFISISACMEFSNVVTYWIWKERKHTQNESKTERRHIKSYKIAMNETIFSFVYASLMAFDEIALNPLFLSAYDVISLPIILCVYPDVYVSSNEIKKNEIGKATIQANIKQIIIIHKCFLWNNCEWFLRSFNQCPRPKNTHNEWQCAYLLELIRNLLFLFVW